MYVTTGFTAAGWLHCRLKSKDIRARDSIGSATLYT